MSTHDMVAHNWANQTGRARNGKNMFYEGNTIYSYGRHFPIARIVENKAGEKAYLFTTRNRSVSTSKHKSIVKRALCRDMPCFEVLSFDLHKENIADYAVRVESILKSAARRRNPGYKIIDLRLAQSIADEARRYARFFRLGNVRLPKLSAETDAQLQALREAELEAQRKKAQERRVDLERVEREDVPRWLAGEKIHLPYDYPRRLMRCNGDMIETSAGACFPIADAREAFPKLLELHKRACEEGGESYTDIRLGDFRVDWVSCEAVRAGCHIVEWKEVIRIANLIFGEGYVD